MLNIVNLETGEIIDELKTGDRILRKSSVDYLITNNDMVSAPKEERFMKVYNAVVPMLSDCNLTASEFIVFMYLASNLIFGSNVAKFENGRIINREHISKELKISEITIKRVIPSLIRHGLIVEANTKDGKAFIINPYVVCVGNSISRTVHDLFRKTKWARW